MFRIICIAAAAVVLGLPGWANESNSGGSEPTAFTATASAAIEWGTWTDYGEMGADPSVTFTHPAEDVGLLAMYFIHTARDKDLTPDASSGAGWKLINYKENVDHSMSVVAKVLDGDDDLTLNEAYLTVTHALIPNGTMDMYIGEGGASWPIIDPTVAIDPTGPANYLSVLFATTTGANSWTPDAPPTGYTNSVSNTLSTNPNVIHITSKRVVNVSSEDPDAWGAVPTDSRAGCLTILIKEKAPASTYLRTGTDASHLGAKLTMDETVTWGKTLDNSGFFVVKDGPLNVISDAPSSAPYDVTGYTPLNHYVDGVSGQEIIAPDGTGTLISNGLMKGADMLAYANRELTVQGFSYWNKNNNMTYDATKNFSPTATENGTYVWPVNEVLIKAVAVPGDPSVYTSALGYGQNNSDNQYRYNDYFIPAVHLSEDPREGALMPRLIDWDGVNLYSIEPEPASPPDSVYTWHHADLSVFDPANLPLKDNGNYDILKKNINQFYGAMNTWSMSGQKQGGNTGANTQTWYYEWMGRAAKEELKYLLGPDSLENKKSTIAAWAAYGLQGLASAEFYNADAIDGNNSKGHANGLLPAVLLCWKIFPTDTALRARITAFLDQAQAGQSHLGIETQNHHYVEEHALLPDDAWSTKHALRAKYTEADIGRPDWLFLTNGYFPENAAIRGGHQWSEVYKGIDWSGIGGMAPLIHQFGGFDAFSTRPAFQAYEDRVWSLQQDSPISKAISLQVVNQTGAFSVGDTVTIERTTGAPDYIQGDPAFGTVVAVDELVGSTILWFTDHLEDQKYTAVEGKISVSYTWRRESVITSNTGGAAIVGGSKTKTARNNFSLIGGIGGLPLAGKLSGDNFGDTAGLYPTVMIADSGYTPYAGTPEPQPAPRLTTSGSTITITPSPFRGLNGGTFVQVDYAWQLMSADRLNEGIYGQEVDGDDPVQNGAWTVQLDGGDTSFTTPTLAPGNYRVRTRVVNNFGAGGWSSNFFYRDYYGSDHANDGMATITVR